MVAEQKKTTRDSLPNNKIDLDADTIENHRRRKDAPISKLTPRSGLVKKKKKAAISSHYSEDLYPKPEKGATPMDALLRLVNNRQWFPGSLSRWPDLSSSHILLAKGQAGVQSSSHRGSVLRAALRALYWSLLAAE